MKGRNRAVRLLIVICAALALLGGMSHETIAPAPVIADVEHTPHGIGGPVSPVTVDVSALAPEPAIHALDAAPQPTGHAIPEADYIQLKAQAQNAHLPMTTAGAAAAQEPAAAVDAQVSAQSLSASFQGFSDTGYFPPDAAIASGPSHVLVAVNASWSVFDKSGSRLSGPISFNALFSPTGLPSGTSYFDPRVVYDTSSGRWFMVAGARHVSSQRSWIMVAVSTSSSPTGLWNTYAFDGSKNAADSTTNWADFPTLGIDSQAVYVTVNMFAWSDGSFQYAKIRILSKAQLLAGGAVEWHDLWDIRDSSTKQAFTLQAALTYGNPGVEYLISGGRTSNGCTNYLTLFAIGNPLDAQPALAQQKIGVSPYCFAPNAEQPGTSERIDTSDPRLLSAVFLNGSLWTAQNVGVDFGSGPVAAIRWYEITAASASVRQFATWGASTAHSYYPTIMPDTSGDATIVFSRSSTTTPVGARYATRFAADSPGSLQASQPLKSGSGTDSYVRKDRDDINRWGDYSAAALDPDGRTVWMLNEYVDTPNKWSMWVGSTSAVPRTFHVGQFYVDVTAKAGGTTVSLGRPIELHDMDIQEGQPLPVGTIPYSGTVAGTTFNAALSLAVTSVDPFSVALQGYQISLGTGQSADLADIGVINPTIPGSTDFTKTATQNVDGIGDITFTFSGNVQMTVQ